jgi:GNAT superfamily N-acetyltransferase
LQNRYTVQVDFEPAMESIERLRRALREFNVSKAGQGHHQSFLITLLGRDREMAGGLFATVSYKWLFIDTLWISERSRSLGNGSRLLLAAEQQGRTLACSNSWVDTFSFQARGFYEKHGYAVFGELPDYPQGHTRYFLRKTL